MMSKLFKELPRPARADIILSHESWFSLVVPEERINYIRDPEMVHFSIEGPVTYYGYGLTGVPVATTARQRRGLHGVFVPKPSFTSGGFFYEVPGNTIGGKVYTFSADHFGAGVYEIAVTFRGGGSSTIARKRFVGYDFWTRPFVSFSLAYDVPVDVGIRTVDDPEAYADGYYVDGFQLEIGDYPTTFISGDLPGFDNETIRPYGWLGSPHNSPSFRVRTTRSGGRVVPLSDMGFDVISFSGVGLSSPEYGLQVTARSHGSLHTSTRMPPKEFQIAGQWREGRDGLFCTRSEMLGYLNPLFQGGKQPVRMIFQQRDCGVPIGPDVEMDVLYQNGADLSYSGPFGERASLSFTIPSGFIKSSSDTTAELDTAPVSENAVSMIGRDPNGEWQIMPGISLGTILDIEQGPDGLTYVLVQNLPGTPPSGEMWRWDGFNWTKVCGFTGGVAWAMAAAPDGCLYIVGEYTATTLGGGAYQGAGRYNTVTNQFDNINNTTFANIGGFVIIRAVVYSERSNQIIIGGGLSQVHNSAMTLLNTRNVAAYSLSTGIWTPIGDGVGNTPSGQVLALAVSSSGIIFAGGTFVGTASDGLTTYNNLAKFNLANAANAALGWEYVDSPSRDGAYALGTVRALKISFSGRLYVGGDFNDSEENNYTGNGYPVGTQHPLTGVAYTDRTGLPLVGASPLRPIGLGVTAPIGGSWPSVFDIAIDCVRGEVWVGGSFLKVLNTNNTEFTSPALAVFSQTSNTWNTPEIQIAPAQSLSGGIYYQVRAISFGQSCDTSGVQSPLGLGAAPVSTPSLFTLGIPPGYAGSLFVGSQITGSNYQQAFLPAVTIVDTGCNAMSRPILRVYGPGKLYTIKNNTTGASLDFAPYLLASGEVLTIDLRRPAPAIYSSVGGSRGHILQGSSDIANFWLYGGENAVKVTIDNLVGGVRASSTKVYATWRNQYNSIDEAICCHE